MSERIETPGKMAGISREELLSLDDFLRDVICDSVNGESHRFVTFTQTDGTEVTACADCGEME